MEPENKWFPDPPRFLWWSTIVSDKWNLHCWEMERENLKFVVVFWNLTEEFDNFTSWFLRAWQKITRARPPAHERGEQK